MIGQLVEAIRDRVIVPQGADTVPAERRVILDPDDVPVDTHPQTAAVVGLTTVPVGPSVIGRPLLSLRHTLALAVVVEHGDPVEAARLRDLIATDIAARLVLLPWHDVELGPGQEYTTSTWSVDYTPAAADEDDGALLAAATFTLDVDVEWLAGPVP